MLAIVCRHGKLNLKMTYYYQESNKLFDDFDCVIKPEKKWVWLVTQVVKDHFTTFIVAFLPAVGGDICIDGQSYLR